METNEQLSPNKKGYWWRWYWGTWRQVQVKEEVKHAYLYLGTILPYWYLVKDDGLWGGRKKTKPTWEPKNNKL